MTKNNDTETQNYKIHVMPPAITDADITALFNGIINVVKKKIELEKNAEIINMNIHQEKLIKELNEKLREIYTAVMSSKTMLEYNTAKAEVDAMLNDINSIIMQCVEGEDPMTAEPHTACTGSCSTCGGCH